MESKNRGNAAAELREVMRDYPDVMVDFATCVFDVLAGEGMKNAAALARQVADRITDEMGGGQVYITHNNTLAARDRAREIYRKFNGRNVRNLAREYKLSERRIYKIIELQQAAETTRRQAMLF